MFKKVLLSALALGALASLVGAGAYAAFTDTGTATGTISTATIDLKLDGLDNATVSFSPQNLLPEESSTATVNVQNNSTRDVHVTWVTDVDSSNEGQCSESNVTVVVTFADGDIDADHPDIHIDNGDSDIATITATLADVGNSCQGITFTVDVDFTVTGVTDAA